MTAVSKRVEVLLDIVTKNEKALSNLNKDVENISNSMSDANKQASKTAKGVSDSSRTMSKELGNLAKIAASAFAVGQIVSFGRSVFNTATELEALDRKASIVLGSFESTVRETANQSSLAMGLTRDQFVGATADIADILVPMGFLREEAGAMALDLTQLSGALSEWSKGQFDAQEASQVLAKALVGETEQLKSMGIVIDQSSKQYNARIKQLMELENVTQQQARALDIQRQIVEQSTDAQEAYTTGGGTLLRSQQQITATVGTLRNEFARGLIPVLGSALNQFIQNAGGAQELAEKAKQLGESVANATVGFISFMNDFVAQTQRGWVAIGNLIGRMREFINTSKFFAAARNEIAFATGESGPSLPAGTSQFFAASGGPSIAGFEEYRENLKKGANQMMEDFKKTTEEINGDLGGLGGGGTFDLPDAVGVGGGGSSRMVKDTEKALSISQQIHENFAGDMSDSWKAAQEKMREEQEETAKQIEEYRDTVENDLSRAWETVGQSIQDSSGSIQEMKEEFSELGNEIDNLYGSQAQGLAKRALAIEESLKGLGLNKIEIERAGSAISVRNSSSEEEKALQEELKLIRENITSAELEQARQRADENSAERILRETQEKVSAIEEERNALEERINTEQDQYKHLTDFKINLDNAYQQIFEKNINDQISLYDRLIQKASEANSSLVLGGGVSGGFASESLPQQTPNVAASSDRPVNVSVNMGNITMGEGSNPEKFQRMVEEGVTKAIKKARIY